MKILHILNELKPSGAETMLLSAAPSWLARSGQHILTTGDTEGSFAQPLRSAGYGIYHLPFDKSFAFFKALGRLVTEEGFDVVHLHTERASLWYALTARLMCRRDLKLVRTVHHMFRFDGLFRIRRMLERQVMKHLLGVHFLSNSPSGKRNELRRFHMDNELAPNWYDSGKFIPPTPEARREARVACGFGADTTVFVSLGGNWEYKNYDLIIRALAVIPPDLDILYVQIGVQGEGSPLESLASDLGVSHRLQCAGVVVDAIPFLHAADCYMMPSSEEGFGCAAVEAMACGLPAILSDVEALCDFRENIQGIRYIEPITEAVANAMVELAGMQETERRELGEIQAKDVEANYGLGVGPEAYFHAWIG